MHKAITALLTGGRRLLSSPNVALTLRTTEHTVLVPSPIQNAPCYGTSTCRQYSNTKVDRGWKWGFATVKGAVEQAQSAAQQTQASSWTGSGHRIVQQLMPRRAFQQGQGGAYPIKGPQQHSVQGWRRLSTSGAAKAEQAGSQASQAVRAVQSGGKGAASAAYRSLPDQARKMLDSAMQPGAAQKALSMQVESFWQRHGNKVLGLGAVFLLYVLWKTMFGVTSIFVNLSETMAEFGFLALSAAIIAFAGLYLRSRYSIRPDAVYRKALVQLNTNPAILEVMGAPVAGSDLRAQILTGGGLRLKNLQPRIRSRRLQMLFWATGTERRGLVSLEAKKQKGRYLFKLLAVDVPSAAGPEQRIYLEGDARTYNRGAVLREMRDPLLNALAMQDAYEAEDEVDDAADDAAEAQQKRSRAAALASGARLPDTSAYFHERLYWGVRHWVARMWDSSKEGEGQKAPTALPMPSIGEEAAATKTSDGSGTARKQTAPAA
ncbi:g5715 [Coccomyxa viridis]|uniref:G5715 protein n=1 Tax=Coccomyxa viridis TaxID=1274662 RepID=A0ABP1FW21_9CHLO